MKNLLRKIFVLGLLLTPFYVNAYSQEIENFYVKGVVSDQAGPIIGATVLEQGTSNGVSTGLDGDYVLNVSSADVNPAFAGSTVTVIATSCTAS